MVVLRAVLAGLLLVLSVFGCGKTEPPSAPTNVVATVGTDGRVTVTWDAVEGATNYVVFRGGSAGIESKVLVAAYVSGTSYVDTPTYVGTCYYQVTALNKGGQSRPSNDVSAVGRLAVSATSAKLLSWNTLSSDFSYSTTTGFSYKLYRSAASDMSGSSEVTLALYMDPDAATLAGNYYYQAVATFTDSLGGTVTNNSLPLLVSYLKLTVSSLAFSWNTDIPSAVDYKLYRSAAADMTGEVEITLDGANSDTTAASGATYYYRVKALDGSDTPVVLETSFVQTVVYP